MMKVYRRVGLAITLTLLLFATLAACTMPGSPAQGEPIRIGVIVAEAPNSSNVTSTLHAAELAASEINEAGLMIQGKVHRVEVITRVIENTPEEAVAAAQQLINQERIVTLVGPQRSSNAIPVSELAQQAGIPMISPASTNPATTLDKPFVFRVAFLDPYQGQSMARFAYEALGARRAGVLYDIANDYNRGVAELFKAAFEGLGGEVVAFESYTSDQESYEAQLARIAEAAPEVLLLPNFSQDLLRQVPVAREMGIEATFLGSDSWNPSRLEGHPEFVGAYATHHWHVDVDREKSRTFVAAYRSRFQDDPLNVTALTYDAFQLIFEAIRSQDSAQPAAIQQGLAAIQEFEGVTGKMSFDENGDPIKSVVILQMEDGSTRLHQIIEP